jgi:sulfite exporter TauE/SafE
MTCHSHGVQLLGGGLALAGFGLAGSLHCLGMCGPLSALLGRGPELRSALPAYHAGRLAAYGVLGILFFLAGAPLRGLLPWPWLPLLWALPLLLFALRPSQPPAWLGAAHRRLSLATLGWRPWQRGLALGLLTPLLPCGLLYAAAGTAVSAPNAWTAAGWMLAFGLGSAPGLLLGQSAMGWLARVRGGAWAAALQRCSAALTAFVLLLLSWPQ